MKRSWIGLGILLALLALCLITGRALDTFQAPLSQNLLRAASCAQEERWPQAQALAAAAQEDWNRSRGKIACVADHTPMEEIDELFARLSHYTGEKEEYAATCAALRQKLRAIAQAHSLTWWSFL